MYYFHLAGWGTGLNYISVLTVYQPYFNKRKALSLGITGAGAGIGTMVISPLLRLFFDNYTFPGAMLLNGK